MQFNSPVIYDNSAPERRIWGVGALCKAVSDTLQSKFNPVAVKGEITGFTRATSGHCYFSIKDAEGQLRCAMFKRSASQLDFQPRDGQAVEVFGKLGVYEARGELQMVVESMRKAGLGTLFEEFLKLKAKLEGEGLFDEARKREIPQMPRRIGVVTSLNAAALHDVCIALNRRVPHIEVLIAPAVVQGVEAPGSLISALKSLYVTENVDVILLVRGGGSIEDLWGFNNEQLARTIVESPVPVISGVGHETDFTIADFCADLRAPTPTAAAELCALPRDVLLERLSGLSEWLTAQAHLIIDRESQRLDYLQQHLGRPSEWLHAQEVMLTRFFNRLREGLRKPIEQANNKTQLQALRLSNAIKNTHQSRKDRLQRAGIRLELLDPSLVLKRGYAWLSNSQGVPVTQVKQLEVGQLVQATLGDGEADLSVISKSITSK